MKAFASEDLMTAVMDVTVNECIASSNTNCQSCSQKRSMAQCTQPTNCTNTNKKKSELVSDHDLAKLQRQLKGVLSK